MSTVLATSRRITFRVHGVPVTQGSTRAFVPRGWRVPIITHDNGPELLGWRDAIASEALRAREGELLTGPVAIHLAFHLQPPQSRPKELRTLKQRAAWAHPARRPDLDKLIRGVFDAITGILIGDDSQIVRIEATKAFSHDPGVEIAIIQRVPTTRA